MYVEFINMFNYEHELSKYIGLKRINSPLCFDTLQRLVYRKIVEFRQEVCYNSIIRLLIRRK